MNIKISEAYKNYRQELLDIVTDFDSKGTNFIVGQRNTIKLFKLDHLQINSKSFKIPNLLNRVVYRYFRKSKAQRSFENAIYLQSKGIGTPTPIAYIEDTNRFILSRSYYLCEHLEIDLMYKDLLENPNYPKREEILRAFVHFTHSLHEHQILFKDHSPGNTLIQQNGDQFSFFLVDLNRMKFKELSLEERITNFTRLTPHKEMIATMSDEYSKITGVPYNDIFNLMWGLTEKFQQKFYRKIALKNKYLFWRKKKK